jgi:hypothetical protein
MKRINFILTILILFQSCSLQKRNPKEFGFRIETETSIINSFDSTYTRRYVEKNSIIKLNFSEKEMELIFNEFIKNGLDNFPQKIEPYFYIYEVPSFETKLQIIFKKRIIDAIYCSSCDYNVLNTKEGNQIFSIEKSINFIDSIVNSKEDVRNPPETNMTFQ